MNLVEVLESLLAAAVRTGDMSSNGGSIKAVRSTTGAGGTRRPIGSMTPGEPGNPVRREDLKTLMHLEDLPTTTSTG